MAEQPEKATLPRQFVTFTFYRARPEWRALGAEEKEAAKRELVELFDSFRKDLLIHTYSIVGLRSNVDFMVWRIGYHLDPSPRASVQPYLFDAAHCSRASDTNATNGSARNSSAF